MIVVYFSCNFDVSVRKGKPCLPTAPLDPKIEISFYYYKTHHLFDISDLYPIDISNYSSLLFKNLSHLITYQALSIYFSKYLHVYPLGPILISPFLLEVIHKFSSGEFKNNLICAFPTTIFFFQEIYISYPHRVICTKHRFVRALPVLISFTVMIGTIYCVFVCVSGTVLHALKTLSLILIPNL